MATNISFLALTGFLAVISRLFLFYPARDLFASFILSFLPFLQWTHPFQDGNGRLSRVLTNLLLLQAGYAYIPYISHEKLIENNKPDYYMALRTSQRTFHTDNESILPWLKFFLGVVYEQSRQALALLSGESVEKLLSPAQLRVWEYMQEKDEVTPRELAETLAIARPTISQVLNKLLGLQKIERIGLGRATRYRRIA